MQTPFIWSLNFRGIDFLRGEHDKWLPIAQKGDPDAVAYFEAVKAELTQRDEQYAMGTFSAITAGLMALPEALGGTAGKGAAGLTGEVLNTASSAAGGLFGEFKKLAGWLLVGGLILGAFYLFLRYKK